MTICRLVLEGKFVFKIIVTFQHEPAVVVWLVGGIHHDVGRRVIVGAVVLVRHVIDQHVQVDKFLRPVADRILFLVVLLISDQRDCVTSPVNVGHRRRDQSGNRAGTAHVHRRGLRARWVAQPGYSILPRLPIVLQQKKKKI